MHRLFGRYGRWVAAGVGVVAAGSATSLVFASTSWSPSHPSAVPFGDTFPKWDYNWDKREPYSLIKSSRKSKKDKDEEGEDSDSIEKKKATAIRHIVLIRHGQYNLDGKGDANRYLTKLGQEQATLTGKRLRSSGITFTSIITSNMCRAIETTEILLKNLGQEGLEVSCQDPLLREGAPCLPEPPVASWRPDLYQYYEDGARIEAAFRKYFHRAAPDQEKDSYEIIVCHANVIRYFICRAMQFPPEAWLRISLNHTSISLVSILPSGRVVLRSLGDSGHLPADKMTTS